MKEKLIWLVGYFIGAWVLVMIGDAPPWGGVIFGWIFADWLVRELGLSPRQTEK